MVRRRCHEKSGWDAGCIGARHGNAHVHVAQPVTWESHMDNLLFKKNVSLIPPYPPTPFPHASGGKGEQNTSLWEFQRQRLRLRFNNRRGSNPKLLSSYSPFPSACVGERAGDRGAINFRSTFALLLILALSLSACQSTQPPP